MKYNLNATKISTLAKFELTNLPWWLWLTRGVVVAGIIVSIVLIATLHKEKTKKKLKVKVVEQQNEIVENVNKEDSFEEMSSNLRFKFSQKAFRISRVDHLGDAESLNRNMSHSFSQTISGYVSLIC